jgi:hypothetical protein
LIVAPKIAPVPDFPHRTGDHVNDAARGQMGIHCSVIHYGRAAGISLVVVTVSGSL